MYSYSIHLRVLWKAGIRPGLVLVTLLALVMLLQRTAMAATIYVNSKADTNDGTCDFQHCTLREAIVLANSNPGHDTIKFDILDEDLVKSIILTSELPPLTGPIALDGYSQLGASPNTLEVGNNAVIRIEIVGKQGSPAVLSIGSDSSVKGLAIFGGYELGIKVTGDYNSIWGNFIGFRKVGSATGGHNGIRVKGSHNKIGYPSKEGRNVIVGIEVSALIEIQGSENKILNNYLGTNLAGTAKLGLASFGILVSSGSKNLIGGTSTVERNIIVGNDASGISILNSARNIVVGNYIGTDASGIIALPNEMTGIYIKGSRNKIGGIEDGEGNVIAFNGWGGLTVESGTRNAIRGNSIFSNNLPGIDLGIDGVTLNDRTDNDTGANDLQNFPILTLAKAVANGTKIKATLTTTPKFLAMLEFFSTKSCDPSGYGEGQTFIGRSAVGTDENGKASVNQVFAPKVAVGEYITATATDALGNTSEFSKCLKVNAP